MLSFTSCYPPVVVRLTFAPTPIGMCYLKTLSLSEGVASNDVGIDEETVIRKEAVVA
jgi:hypothetical protein